MTKSISTFFKDIAKVYSSLSPILALPIWIGVFCDTRHYLVICYGLF